MKKLDVWLSRILKTSAMLIFHARSHETPERSKYDLEEYEE